MKPRKVKKVKRVKHVDPTRTTGIRARWVREVNRRFAALLRDIKTSIVQNDCFGFNPKMTTLEPIPVRRFQFDTNIRKLQEFMRWLNAQEEAGILHVVGRGNWTTTYIDSAYLQGLRRSRLEMQRSGYDIKRLGADYNGQASIMSTFHSPIHTSTVAELYMRTFEDLKTVTQVMNSRLRHSIADGLRSGISQAIAEGQSIESATQLLMQDISNGVNQIGITRARLIARTETIRAHHVATVTEYKEFAKDMLVTVQAEFLTADDDLVCDECADMEGNIYTLDEAEGLIPVHPNCRCAVIPYVAEEEESEAA